MSVNRTSPFHFRRKFVTLRPVNRAPKERQRGDAAGGTRGRRPRREVPSARPAGPHIVELLAFELSDRKLPDHPSCTTNSGLGYLPTGGRSTPELAQSLRRSSVSD